MKNRAILSRIRGNLKHTSKSTKASILVKEVQKLDPVTKEVLFTYPSVDAVIADGFSKSNLFGALKNGNKYKGFLWGYAE